MRNNVKDFEYKISVVMPLYNVEQYLVEAVDSIINQSIGFIDNIQLILVNDGSQDELDKICHIYQEKFPDNVIYLEQENSGVSSARNNGLELVKGKYVTFLDGDDKWDKDAFKYMYDFIEKYYNSIDFVAARYCFFESKKGFNHTTDYKFTSTRIVDIAKEYDCVQLSSSSTMIKSDVARKYQFDSKLKYSEDSLYMTQILFEKMRYGVIREAVYYYRKRASEDSAVDSSYQSLSWYFDTPQYCYAKIFEESKRLYGEIIPYAQYLIMYDLQWRLKRKVSGNLSIEEKNRYISIIYSLINCIDDKIICEQKHTNIALKVFALSIKHNEDVSKELRLINDKVYYNNIYLFSVKNDNRLKIDLLSIERDILYIEGILQLHILKDNYSLVICDDCGNPIETELFRDESEDVVALTGDVALDGRRFKIKLPLNGRKSVEFYLCSKNGEKIALAPSFIKDAKLDKKQKSSYYSKDGYIIKKGAAGIRIKSGRFIGSFISECQYCIRTLIPNHKFKIAIIRFCALLYKLVRQKPLKIVFCGDEEKTVEIKSLKCKMLVLSADGVISSGQNDWDSKLFKENLKYVNNMINRIEQIN